MNIGFDFDKVFIDYPPVVPAYLVDRLYKKKSNGILLYRIPSHPEQLFRRATHLSFLRPVIKENLQVLQSISKEHNKLFLVSSRYGFLEQVTNRIVKKHGFDTIFDGLYFNFSDDQPHEFKAEVIKKLKLDRYVDDDLALLRHVAKANPGTQFYWLNRRERGKVTENIRGITKLSELLN